MGGKFQKMKVYENINILKQHFISTNTAEVFLLGFFVFLLDEMFPYRVQSAGANKTFDRHRWTKTVLEGGISSLGVKG